VEAIDPDAALVRAARRALPARLAGRVRYRTAGADRLPVPAASFSRVLFAWSL
jgi:ubiquinone/menaquinone biosynthesis C-methylase UbiE